MSNVEKDLPVRNVTEFSESSVSTGVPSIASERNSGDRKIMSDSEKVKSVKNVAEFFANSLITGVPNIAIEQNRWKKLFRILVFLGCILGFSFQIWEFISVYLTYPTVIELNIRKEAEFIHPAVTFCSNSPMKLSKYCSKYPGNCKEMDNLEKFCYEYPHYCRGNMTNFKISERFSYHSIHKADLLELGYNLKDLIPNIAQYTENQFESYVLVRSGDADMHLCYSFHFRADVDKEPYKIGGSFNMNEREMLSIRFHFEPGETLHRGISPGGVIGIHSPFNHHAEWIDLKPGMKYHISVRMEVEHLLPYPYESDCRDYLKEWIKNNKTGPRSREMCRHLCIESYYIHKVQCVPQWAFLNELVHYDNMCENYLAGIFNLPDEIEEITDCIATCKESCLKWRYVYTMNERTSFGTNPWVSTKLRLYLKDPPVTVISHQPKYQAVELFSHIGGYLGLWLGFCMISCIDFFASLLEILCFYWKRMVLRKKLCYKLDQEF